MWLGKQELKKNGFIVLEAVVVNATLQQAWDHSTYITVTMTAIATGIRRATLTLTALKPTVTSTKASRCKSSKQNKTT